jgi:peptidoglycan/LPS O-acetylase OafA/YrhL
VRFATIDGLRGIAAMAVVVFHLNEAARITYGDWLPPLIDWIFRRGFLGVDIFFVLSGFVIAYSVRNADLSGRFIGWFALRRALRLDPPYWAAVALEIGVQWLALRLALSASSLPSLPQVLAHLFYLQNLLGLGDIVDVFWTLCFEIQFYLALISLLVLRRKLAGWLGHRPTQWLSAITLASLFAASICLRYGVGGVSGHPGVALIRWYQFFMGACVWWVVSGKVRWHVLVATWTALLAVVIVERAEPLQLLPIGVSGLMWWSYRRDGMATILSNRVAQFLGAISYSLYLFHTTIGWRLIRISGSFLDETSHRAAMILVFAVSIAVCVLAAWIGWRILEEPSLGFSRRIALPKLSDPGRSLARGAV